MKPKPGSARRAAEGETLSGNLSTITSKLGSPQFSKRMIMLVSVCLVAQMQIAVVEFPAPNKRSCPSARYMAGCKRPHGNLGDSVCSTSRDTASHTDEGRDPFSGWTKPPACNVLQLWPARSRGGGSEGCILSYLIELHRARWEIPWPIEQSTPLGWLPVCCSLGGGFVGPKTTYRETFPLNSPFNHHSSRVTELAEFFTDGACGRGCYFVQWVGLALVHVVEKRNCRDKKPVGFPRQLQAELRVTEGEIHRSFTPLLSKISGAFQSTEKGT